MQTYLSIVQIILALALTGLILLEVRSGGLGGAFGGVQTGLIRKRRGTELLIFQLTVGTSVAFFVVSMLTVLASG